MSEKGKRDIIGCNFISSEKRKHRLGGNITEQITKQAYC
jgi:hypothetical protein